MYSITQCPPRFVGDAKRLCVLRDVRQPEWDIPDFSSCVSESLVEIQNNVSTPFCFLFYLLTSTSYIYYTKWIKISYEHKQTIQLKTDFFFNGQTYYLNKSSGLRKTVFKPIELIKRIHNLYRWFTMFIQLRTTRKPRTIYNLIIIQF